MKPDELRRELIRSLEDIYRLEAFSVLQTMLQGESQTLRYLAQRQNQTVYPSDLSRDLQLSRSCITGTLSALRRKGLIDTEASEEDRRRVRARITPAGAALIAERMEKMEHYFDQMLSGLGTADAESLVALIDRCVTVMEG